jgi:hypothetical protein
MYVLRSFLVPYEDSEMNCMHMVFVVERKKGRVKRKSKCLPNKRQAHRIHESQVCSLLCFPQNSMKKIQSSNLVDSPRSCFSLFSSVYLSIYSSISLSPLSPLNFSIYLSIYLSIHLSASLPHSLTRTHSLLFSAPRGRVPREQSSSPLQRTPLLLPPFTVPLACFDRLSLLQCVQRVVSGCR